jgi:ribose/xylose/arabinose/galactoside ABC-type transport system permease subunit
LLSVLTSSTYYAIMAVGITGVIVMGGIDLSVGSIYCLAAVVGAMMLRAMGMEGGSLAGTSAWLVVPLTFLVCAGVGAACGLVNGLGTVLLRVHPFIITLGTMSIFRGLAYLFSSGESVTGFPAQIGAGFVRHTLPTPFGPVEMVPLLLTVIVTVVGAVVFSRTVFGRRTYAIGGNETAARYAGVPVGSIKVWLFVLCGVAAGLAALIQLGRYGAADSTAGRGDELRVIASAVVGGASLAGGRGSAVGAVLGAIIIALINNATIILDVPPSWTDVVLGMTIVVAVVVDQTKQRLARARK